MHDDRALSQRTPRQLELALLDDPVGAHPAGQLQQFRVHQGVAADQPERVGRRVGPDHAVDVVHHHEGASDDGENLGGTFRKGRFADLHQARPLPLAGPVGEEANHTQGQAHQAGEHSDQHIVHATSVSPAIAAFRTGNGQMGAG